MQWFIVIFLSSLGLLLANWILETTLAIKTMKPKTVIGPKLSVSKRCTRLQQFLRDKWKLGYVHIFVNVWKAGCANDSTSVCKLKEVKTEVTEALSKKKKERFTVPILSVAWLRRSDLGIKKTLHKALDDVCQPIPEGRSEQMTSWWEAAQERT